MQIISAERLLNSPVAEEKDGIGVAKVKEAGVPFYVSSPRFIGNVGAFVQHPEPAVFVFEKLYDFFFPSQAF
jgi:hypothetical protein